MKTYKTTISNPGFRKRSRWNSAIHEVGHAVVHLATTGRGAVCEVFSRPRRCRGVAKFDQGESVIHPLAFPMSIAAGPISENILAYRHDPPAGRPRGKSGTRIRDTAGPSDAKRIAGSDKSMREGFIRQGVDPEKAEQVAAEIAKQIDHDVRCVIYDRESEIISLARQLYLRGRIRIWGERQELNPICG